MRLAARVLGCVLFAVAFAVVPLRATTITLDFEGLSDGTAVADTYLSQGASFTDATVLTAGISLNEIEFPPHSGENIVTDNSGPIIISFANPVSLFSAYFTYATQLQLAAFTSSNDLVSTATSLYSENFVSSGNPPNEQIQLSNANGFSSVTITGDPGGGSFVMDDVTFTLSTSVTPPTVPEPSMLSLLIGGLLVGAGIARRHRAGKKSRLISAQFRPEL